MPYCKVWMQFPSFNQPAMMQSRRCCRRVIPSVTLRLFMVTQQAATSRNDIWPAGPPNLRRQKSNCKILSLSCRIIRSSELRDRNRELFSSSSTISCNASYPGNTDVQPYQGWRSRRWRPAQGNTYRTRGWVNQATPNFDAHVLTRATDLWEKSRIYSALSKNSFLRSSVLLRTTLWVLHFPQIDKNWQICSSIWKSQSSDEH